jgi:hypothetical protein
MNVNRDSQTVQVSFRLPRRLVKRMQEVSKAQSWPPPPSQTEIVTHGVELVLEKLAKRGGTLNRE